ncbi:MAG: hypothetical protein IT423_01045 [Pirellulaceae bacterium]|nr:hypothetical protein [Pirellulaceae bacterium]
MLANITIRSWIAERYVVMSMVVTLVMTMGLWMLGSPVASAQLPPIPNPTVPSLESEPAAGSAPASSGSVATPPAGATTGAPRSKRVGGAPTLPTDANQYWEEYDLRPYTKELATVDRPHQAIIDWILRDTGTDAWFTDPFGFINADRNTLRVYHNEQMHQLVRQAHERFVNGTTVPQLFGMRLIAIGNPNWRTRGHTLLRSVAAQSPGVQAFLASKESHALLMAMLRGRSDFKELASVNITTHNGQPQVLEQLRSRNFVREFQPAATWPPYIPVTGEIQEGYRLQVSPLLSLDKQSIDIVVKCHIDQVERLSNVTLDLPLQNGQLHSGQIQVPQLASWRLHERFRWPADEVLILSCGVVASPQSPANNTLLGQGSSIIGLDRILPQTGDRADALLVIEYLGDANRPGAPTVTPTTNLGQTPVNPLSRGRY